MSSIPEEIYQEILLRVPVKSLLVCKCVCKNWYDLISSSDFVKLHLEFTTQKNNPSFMLYGTVSSGLKSIGYDSMASSVCGIENVAIEMDYPFKSLNYNVQLAGSCNGLLCIRLSGPGSGSAGRVDFFCLWNPATRECKEIPKPPACRFYSLYALGYDHKTDDYKLAVGETLRDDNTLVQVYTLASNSWKPAQTVPYGFFNYMQRNGVLVKGDLHWLAIHQNKISLHSLDISEENFKEVQLPPINWNSHMVLGALEGHLCILVQSFANGITIHLEVWEMLDYGVQESWTRRYIITHASIIQDYNTFTSTSPVWCFKNGKILFASSGSLVLYDPEHGSAIKLSSHGNFAWLAMKYFESLVSLSSGTYVGAERGIEELRET